MIVTLETLVIVERGSRARLNDNNHQRCLWWRYVWSWYYLEIWPTIFSLCSKLRLIFCTLSNDSIGGLVWSLLLMRKLTSDIVRLEIHSWYDSLWPLLYSHTIQPSQVMVEHSVGASWGAYSNPETCNIIQKNRRYIERISHLKQMIESFNNEEWNEERKSVF